MRWLIIALTVLLVTGCGSLGIQTPITHSPKFESVQKLVAGERPATPAAAQEWLDQATQDFRSLKSRANLVCLGVAAVKKEYPGQCLALDAWYRREAMPLGDDLQRMVDQWRMNGGALDGAATEYFAEMIGRRIPEVERLLQVLRAFRGGMIEEAPMLPDLQDMGDG